MSRIIANNIRHNDATVDSLSFDSSARVGIGTASPAVTVHAEDAQCELQLKSTSGSNSAGLRFVPGGETNALYIYADGNRNINFDDHATARLQIQNDGDLSISNGNLVLSNGNGIDFSANGNAGGMTSELLDDYEEGTWTPVFADNSGGEATMTVQQGFYTKIGNIVNVWFQIAWSDKGTLGASAVAYFSGFPFSAKSNSSQYYYLGATIKNATTDGVIALAGNGTIAVSQPLNGPSSNQTPSDFNSSGRMMCSMTYFT